MSDTAVITPTGKKPLFGLNLDGTPLYVPVIGLCGPLGSGKTLAALTLCPEETIEIGIEDSGVTYNLPIKKRYSMYQEVTGKNSITPRPIECFEWFMDILKQISEGKLSCRVLAVDPITDIQNGCVDWVYENCEKFDKTKAQYDKASGLLWGDVKSHFKALLGATSRRMDTLVFTAHMGTVWSGGAPVPGKTKAKGIGTFMELASLYVHLTREVDPKTGKQPEKPVGHISPPHGKSRLAHTFRDENGELKITPILPPRIEDFSWAKVRQYVATPPDYAKLNKNELAEVQVMSEEEKMLLQLQMDQTKLAEAEARLELAEKVQKAASRVGAGAVSSTTAKAMGTSPGSGAKRETVPAKQESGPAAAKETAPAKTSEKPAAPASTAAESKSEPKAEATQEQKSGTEKLCPDLNPWNRDQCESIIRQQMTDLAMTSDQMKAAVRKRGGERLKDLADGVLEELRRALWNVATKREMEATKKS